MGPLQSCFHKTPPPELLCWTLKCPSPTSLSAVASSVQAAASLVLWDPTAAEASSRSGVLRCPHKEAPAFSCLSFGWSRAAYGAMGSPQVSCLLQAPQEVP